MESGGGGLTIREEGALLPRKADARNEPPSLPPPAPMSAENRLHNLGVGVRELWFQYENARNIDTEKAF